jgi:MFS family permease
MPDNAPPASAQTETLSRRDLLLTLKYSTLEACFSVPMLNLTLPNLPFLLAYATAALQWKSWAIGLIAALPHICNFIQPPLNTWLQRRFSLQSIMRWSFVANAVPWFCVGLTYKLPWPLNHLAFGVLLTIATLANSISAVSWSAAIGEVVPRRMGGSYFGRRNLIFGAWTLIAVLAAGKIVDLAENDMAAFAWIFAAAGCARFVGLLYLTKMKFPATVTQRRDRPSALSDMFKPLKDANYRTYMLFVGLWGLFLNMGSPFYTVYLIRNAGVPVGHSVLLATLSTLGGILTLRSWGTLADRFGGKPVQYAAAYTWCFVGLAAWAIVAPDRHTHLLLSYMIVGGATAGFQLTQFNLMLKLIPPGLNASYVAVFLSTTSALTCLGPLLGGTLLAILPDNLGHLLGQQLTDKHLLFAISFFGCLLTLPLLSATREPAAHEITHVWRSMWRMRSFNPLLAATNFAASLFTSRGLLSLGQTSVRKLRRQARNLAEVGADIVEGSQTILKRRP